MQNVYGTSAWNELRLDALERDGSRCSLGRLFGGECAEYISVHHLIPISEGGPELPDVDGLLTVCNRHHPSLEAMRRYITGKRIPKWKRCHHVHRYSYARRECERKLNGLPPVRQNIAA